MCEIKKFDYVENNGTFLNLQKLVNDLNKIDSNNENKIKIPDDFLNYLRTEDAKKIDIKSYEKEPDWGNLENKEIDTIIAILYLHLVLDMELENNKIPSWILEEKEEKDLIFGQTIGGNN